VKAIIPVAGAGTKLRPLTYTQPKALIPIAGKTLLGVIIDQLLMGGVTEFVFVIGYLGEKIQHYVAEYYPNLKYTMVTQNDRRGLGHAIWLTADAVQNEEVLIVLGDTICDYDVKKILASTTSQIGVRKVDNPTSFGVAELDDDQHVLKLVEKPKMPKSNMAMVGVYYVKETREMYEAMNQHMASGEYNQDEYYFTNALQAMVENGVQFKAFKVDNWFDCGNKEILLATNATLLRKMNEANNGGDTPYAEKDYIVIPPVSIAAGCVIRNSIIGPNVSVGEHTNIDSCIIKDSIIGSYAKLDDVQLHSSIIGSDAIVHGLSQSLNIGDNTEIDLG
jgi:Nucleoside-diphosphate-sugar pyrophosphorylase involved in lipopolysaccharide biosynthesis/translation initiation factor 2B, gamma/epsilon subunits (eIF-2Bgamma/eIF-2Bepsilon)